MRRFILLVCFSCFAFMAWGQDSELIRKAESGDAEAQYQLGTNYWHGYDGFPEIEKEAAKWMLKAAEQGHAEAQRYIGDFYYVGWMGFPQNKAIAESWYLKSAAQGYDGVYFMLGLFYENINKEESLYWFKKSMDAYYEKTGKENEAEAKYLREHGIYYHPSSKSSSIASTSSSSNSRSSSSNSGYSSSSSSSDDGLLYEGVYTRSSQGYCPQTGRYTDAIGPGFQLRIKIYDSYIMVGGTKCEYVRTSGGWKIYEGNTMFGGTEYYKVNPNNYEMSYYTYSSNPYTGGGITLVYEMKKGDAVFDIRQNNTNTYGSGYSGGSSSYGSNNNRSTSTSNQKICNLCHGTGTCETCAGKHRYLNPYTNKYVTCPNCGPDGRCRGCNGTGRR